MSSPVEQFEELLVGASFLFVVYYRGHWCPFCMSYLKDLGALEEDIIGAHGNTVIVTAEPMDHLAETRRKTGYRGDVIVDAENILVAELQRRDLLSVALSDRSGYPHGMAQPAVLVLKRDGTVLFQWAVAPSLMNLKGAKDRPSLREIWENVEAQTQGKPQVHQTYHLQKFTTGPWQAVRG